MYKIILVEDEPEAAENIYDIIRIYCPRFQIVASGDNGEAGLALARQYSPDLLLTDIRMPVMDGLELIVKLHQEMPQVNTMILSGYQDFEYARTALRHGAADYLLKPISPQTLQAAMDRIIPLLNDTISQRRLPLIRSLLNNEPPDRGGLKKQFGAPGYTAGISRKNGLPRRFHRNMLINIRCHADDETIDMYGRDEMESLHISSGNAILSGRTFDRVNWLHRDIPGYTTTVVWHDFFSVEDLPEVIKKLYTILDNRLTIGKTQIISVGAPNCRYIPKYPHPKAALKQIPGYYVKKNKPAEIRTFLLEQMKKWEAEEQPQLYVEESVRPVFEYLRSELDQASRDEGFEFMIDDAFFYAASYDELRESLLCILEKLLPNPEQRICKVDTPEFFELIRKHTKAHATEALTLQSLCGHFGISQTYMSRLFRKYTGLSFINYLTSLRIEKAKSYLLNKSALIKDAAVLAGFNDQFYFSRVFRSVTGQSPSEYIRINAAL